MGKLGPIEIAGNQTIGNALHKTNLVVPINQRSYRWEERHAKELFDDIEYAIGQGQDEYFLGSIVVTKPTANDTPSVIDGQQRLATTLIFIGAVRDFLLTLGDADAKGADVLQADFLIAQDFYSQEPVQRLRLSDKDNDFFRNRVLVAPNDPARVKNLAKRELKKLPGSHQRIHAAANVAATYVANLVKPFNGAERSNQLRRRIKFLQNGVRVIWVTVPDEANAFVMFETLNDRGLELSKADLLKNYLFGRSGDELTPKVLPQWIGMSGALEAVQDETLIVKYIRHLWSSKYGPTREKDLFVSIKDRIKSKQQAVELSTELSVNARRYAAILSPSHELWNEYGATAQKHIATLSNTLHMEQVRPLLLAILQHISIPETEKCLRFLVRCSVRLLIVGGLGGGEMEAQYAKRALEIRDGTIKTAKDLLKKMDKDGVLPNDTIFHGHFATATVSNASLARYYLRAMEHKKQGQTENEWKPEDDPTKITLEHILPENPEENWPNVEDEHIEAGYWKRFGNVCLMKRTPNSHAGNAPYSVKRVAYKTSQFFFTKDIVAKWSDWDGETIEARQEQLATFAVKTWPLSVN